MSEEYIEREAVIKMLENTDWYTINKNGILVLGASDGDAALFKAGDMFQLVRKAPAADVEPVRHGKWIEKPFKTLLPVEFDDNDEPILHKHVHYKCSICGRVERVKEPYCNCGAKMDEEE